ncbi:alpha-1,2-fucosyltransferase [Clostridia bacterium]|nr:alpha-1,2-fucosyltransferase [Clostridia bacterium]
MIYARIGSGLGNQIYRYAFMRKLQLLTGMDVLIYKDFENASQRHSLYQLDKYKLAERLRVVSANELDEKQKEYIRKCYEQRDKLKPNCASSAQYLQARGMFFGLILIEPIKINKDAKDLLEDCLYLNHAVYDPIRSKLLEDFRFAGQLKDSNMLTMGQIMETPNAVCVHVRRNDSVKHTSKNNWDCDYYRTAMNMMRKKYPDAVFFVFSNDIKFVKREKTFSNCIIVDNNDETEAAEEMELMRACRHFIIPYSTFTFWAQYLSESAGKTVIAPKYRSSERVNPLIMPEWKLLGKLVGKKIIY